MQPTKPEQVKKEQQVKSGSCSSGDMQKSSGSCGTDAKKSESMGSCSSGDKGKKGGSCS